MSNLPKSIIASMLANLVDSYDPVMATQLKNWRSAVAKVKAGTANARVLCVGDSTTFGAGSNGTGGGTGAGDVKAKTWPTKLVAAMQAAGINTHANSFLGDGSGAYGSTAINSLNDARVVMRTGWASSAGHLSVGGKTFIASGATSSLSFTPTVPVDTFIIAYEIGSGFGTISIDINGAGAVTQSTSGTAAIGFKTVTGALGTNTVNINWSSGGQVSVLGVVDAYDSSKKWVNIINAGWSGSASTSWSPNSAAIDPSSALAALNADLTFVILGINDWVNPTTLPNFNTAMQTIITAAKSMGDCVLVTPVPSINSMVPLATQQTYIAAIMALAQTNDCLVIDNFGRWQSYEISNPLGLYYNSWHPNAVGYMDFMSPIAALLTESGINAISSGGGASGVSSLNGLTGNPSITSSDATVGINISGSNIDLSAPGGGGGGGIAESTGTWTISDVSGASLAFTNTAGNGYYIKIGHLCFCQFRLNYPVTSSSLPSYIGTLPFTCASDTTNWIWGGFMSMLGVSGITMIVDNGGTRFGFYDASGNQVTNATLSNKQLRGVVVYKTV